MFPPYAFGDTEVHICPPRANGLFYPLPNGLGCRRILAEHSQGGWFIFVVHLKPPDDVVLRFLAKSHPTFGSNTRKPTHVAPWFARTPGLDEQPQLSSQLFNIQRWLEGASSILKFPTANVEDGSVNFGDPAFVAQLILPI